MTEQSRAPGVVYPRFIGVDDSGDYVWELESGRWTFGDDPYSAATRTRTFEPERYLDKYGPLEIKGVFSSAVVAAPVEDRTTPVTNRKNGMHRALEVTLQTLDGWIEGVKSNHEAMGHGGRESTGSECWRTFSPSDIRRMINDAARELGLAEFPVPTDPEEDKAL